MPPHHPGPGHPLSAIGWRPEVAARWAAAGPAADGLEPARAVRTDRGEVTVWAAGDGADVVDIRATMTKAARLVVAGDWVGVDRDTRRVGLVLPRLSAFVRRSARGAASPQVLAANMDTVAVVLSGDRGVNVRRLERELVLAYESGAEALVLLTKVDLCPDRGAAAVAEARTVSAGADVVAVSPPAGIGLDEVRERIGPGRTFALLGASGAGKSTLVNALAGHPVQLTAETRSGDGKGRHTTTAAQLIRLPGDRLLIDTPGVRALALWQADLGLQLAFPEIEEWSAGCRFDDCSHRHEPGCAVLAAVADGRLDPDRLDNWQRMHDELTDLESI